MPQEKADESCDRVSQLMDSDMQGQWYESPALRGSPADVRYARNAPEMLEGLWIRVEHDFSTFQEYW